MPTTIVIDEIPVVFQGERENTARRCVGLFDCLCLASEDQELCQTPVVLQVMPRREEVVPVARSV